MEECTKAPIIKLSKATKGRVRFDTKEEVREIDNRTSTATSNDRVYRDTSRGNREERA